MLSGPLKRAFGMLVMVVCWATGLASSVYADSAVVVPKGYFYFNFEDRWGLPTQHQFNNNGDRVSIGTPFSRDLDSQVLTPLQGLNPFVGGNASLGTSQVQITRSVNEFRPLLA